MTVDVDQSTDRETDEAPPPRTRLRGIRWSRIVAFGVLPCLAVLLAAGAGYLKWRDVAARQSEEAAAQSVQAATESTIAMLAYQPDTVEQDLTGAADRLSGSFRDDYLKLINDVVIPGSVEKGIGAIATVPAAASVSATANHAVVLVYVNQSTTIGGGAQTNSISSVELTMDRVGERWLVSHFQPV